MSITPLNESVDLKDHYLAFIELENFGIEKELPDERSHIHNHFYPFQLYSIRLSVRQLKDTIQLSLLQQSEYLRRFSLTFCQKVGRTVSSDIVQGYSLEVREDDKLNKSGVLRHVKEIISKLGTVSDKMCKILEYHQALGLVPLPELDQKSLTLKRQLSLDQVKVF